MKTFAVALCFLALASAMPADFTTYNGHQRYPQQLTDSAQYGYGTTSGYTLHRNTDNGGQHVPFFNSYPVSGGYQPYGNGQYPGPQHSSHDRHNNMNNHMSPYAGVMPVGYPSHQ